MGDFKKPYPKLVAFFNYYQMLGGLIGLLVTFILLKNPSSDSAYILRIVTQTLVFLLSFYCGYTFLNKDDKRGIDLSIFCHVLQLFQVKAGGIFYVFASGLGFFVPISGTPDESATLISTSTYNLELSPLDATSFWSINLIAVVMLILLIILKFAYAKNK